MSTETPGLLSMISREAFFEACKAKAQFAIVDVPEIGAIGIRPLTPAMLEAIDKDAKSDFDRAVLTVYNCIVDSTGANLFASRKEVADLPLPVFQALSEAVGEQNGLKRAEDAAKN